MPSANALWLGDVRLRIPRPICGKHFPALSFFCSRTESTPAPEPCSANANRWVVAMDVRNLIYQNKPYKEWQ